MKKVYKVDQLPGFIDENCVEWDLHDHECNVRITKQENGKSKLSGEWLEWNEEEQDWKERRMTRDEIIDIINQVDLVIPSTPPIHLKDRFFKKPA